MLIDTDSPTANALVPLTPRSTAVATAATTNFMLRSWIPSAECCSASRPQSSPASGRARDLPWQTLNPSNRTGPSGESNSCAHDADGVEAARQDWRGIRSNHVLQHPRVNGAEVGVELQVAVAIQVAEARVRAVQATLDLVADDEHRLRGTVVSATRAVLLHPPTKLGERHDDNVVLLLHVSQILRERLERVAKLSQVLILGRLLVRVGVVATHADRKQPRSEVARDHLRHHLELVRQPVVGWILDG